MLRIPQSLQVLIDELSDLPSIGPRQATRLAFHLVGKGKQNLENLSGAMKAMESIRLCEQCYFIHENEDGLCDICSDPMRNQKLIMIVEKETDLISIEQTKKFSGRYLVLSPIPKTGVLTDTQKMKLSVLKMFIEHNIGGVAEEIILAFNPTSVGDWNAGLLKKELEALTKKITRLGRGLPTGGEIEFADDETLEGALLGRS